jgi:CRISPR/Cas system type I-B associated protein Csh2 (Cas7 group RAMP superfamily)
MFALLESCFISFAEKTTFNQRDFKQNKQVIQRLLENDLASEGSQGQCDKHEVEFLANYIVIPSPLLK